MSLVRRAGLCLLCACALASAAGCGELDNFDVPVKARATIPGAGPLGNLLDVFPPLDGFNRFDISRTSEFENREHSPDDVDSVVLESLVMRVVSPAGQDLSFFGTVTFRLDTAELPDIEVARRSDFPAGQSEVAFTTVTDDLKAYVLAAEGTMTADVQSSRAPPQETVVELEAIFDVDVNVAGL